MTTIFINNAFRSGSKTFDTINPATEEKLATLAAGNASDIDEAVRAAHAAFEAGEWANCSGAYRAKLLRKIADGIEAEADKLALLDSKDGGKPITGI